MTVTEMSIDSISSTDSVMTITSSAVKASELSSTHSFRLQFSDNLFSPAGVMYRINAEVNTDSAPWVIREYFDLNLLPYYLIGIFFALAALVIILMRIKHVYRVVIEYVHCIQLLGLTLFCLYPHSYSLDLYSFIRGLDYSNFSFMYNVPRELIEPCLFPCTSLTSFAFAQGDMNWLRLMGALLLCGLILLFFFILISCFKCSRDYSFFFIAMVCDLLLVKTIHSWFSSLLYGGLNLKTVYETADVFMVATHFFSYVILLPILVPKIKAMWKAAYPNLSLIGTFVFVILLSLLSLAPVLICCLLVIVTFC